MIIEIPQQVTEATVIAEQPSAARNPVGVALLTGGYDKHYTLGLARALATEQIQVDVIGGTEIDSPELHAPPFLRFLDLRGDKAGIASLAAKGWRVLRYYLRLWRYASAGSPKIFHILWNNKFEFFDRTMLMAYYKLLGKKVVFTAHNVNAGIRDGNDSWSNRFSLKCQYKLADRIFVHTEKMKRDLVEGFGKPISAVHVIPYGINDAVPVSTLSRTQARKSLGVGDSERVILFFGTIRPYKGIECLISAFNALGDGNSYHLVIAGEPKRESTSYLSEIQEAIQSSSFPQRITLRPEHIPDEEIERYFKAADVLALPYRKIFQSGILFLGYSFGLPVVASDVGSFREDIVEGKTGFLCKADDIGSLAEALKSYFESALYRDLEQSRPRIRNYAQELHSWKRVGQVTKRVYEDLIVAR